MGMSKEQSVFKELKAEYEAINNSIAKLQISAHNKRKEVEAAYSELLLTIERGSNETRQTH
jgi:hypothetical protein